MRRLTPATLTFGVMAIMGLLVAAYVVRTLMARETKAPEVATRNMPTPVVDIPVGTEITEKHLGNAPTLVSTLTPDMLANQKIIIGRVAREPLKKAVPIRANQLYGPGERPPLKVAKGMEAYAIDLDSATAMVDGLIKPGDHCDILFTVSNGVFRDDRLPYGYQLCLFKGVKVLAINRNVVQQTPNTNGNTVVLEVRPGQANALELARKNGTLTLVYNPNPTKGGVVVSDDPTDRLTLEKLLDLPPKKPAPEPPRPPAPYTVDQYRGLRRSTISYLPNGRVLDYNNLYGVFGYGSPYPGWMGAGGYPGPVNNTLGPNNDQNSVSPVTPAAPNGTPGAVSPTTPTPASPGGSNNSGAPNGNPGLAAPVGPTALFNGWNGTPNSLFVPGQSSAIYATGPTYRP